MKLIKLNESQYKRLFEEDIETFGQNSNPEYFNQENVSCQSPKLKSKDGKSTVDADPIGGIKKTPWGYERTGLDRQLSAKSNKRGLGPTGGI